uniref:Peptide Cn29 n=1 Tax=Centruroides noxius TaxID=6878 RepID=SCX29_CENNO|nr:RecName: Full=Peptide Cn29 [Centruroides noxius]6NW8_A Chain A, Cn29 [Centruroides noxius]
LCLSCRGGDYDCRVKGTCENGKCVCGS